LSQKTPCRSGNTTDHQNNRPEKCGENPENAFLRGSKKFVPTSGFERLLPNGKDVEAGGTVHQPPPRGCPLNPLLAGFHLYELDRQLASLRGTRYLRFMDNLLILARTRW
jgi:hypothetical protein